ncbi:MAG: Fic family protein [Pseudomonadota bacterium]
MATPGANLATSLEILKTLQDRGITAIRTSHLTRIHRERLLKNGFLREVMKGWYIPARPDEQPGESTAWYASFWSFVADYLNQRFADEWCLSPEQSIAIHTGDWTVPRQVLLRTPAGGNKPVTLPFGTSILDARLELPQARDMEVNEGLRIYQLPAALIACSPTNLAARPVIMRAALAGLGDPSELLRRLLDGGHSRIAGRLVGGLRNIGQVDTADNILETMRVAGYTVSEFDPFGDLGPVTIRAASAPVHRLRMLWEKMRTDVLDHFTPPSRGTTDRTSYLRHVDEVYVVDAYNSLSIEGYRVSAELIERVRSRDWNSDTVEADRNPRDALAARGYWQAFQRVKLSVTKVLDAQNAGKVVNADHGAWYRELFAPSVAAGLVNASGLAGYRNGPVFIRRSMHVPARAEAMRDLVPAFFDLLTNEPEPAVRVVLGHFMFVYIHPYFDGNGRMGRFMLNVMMASGGYAWTIVPLEARAEYMAALEAASAGQNIIPFTQFLDALVNSSAEATIT